MFTDPASGRRWRDPGDRMLAYGPDTVLFIRALRDGVRAIRAPE